MNVTVAGLEDILKNLNQFEIDESLENKALNKAGKITHSSILEETPIDNRSSEDAGTLKNNIRLRRAKNGEVTIHTGGAFHAHLVEFGRSGGTTTMKNGRRVTWGPTAPNPFFSRGYEQSKNAAMNAMVDAIKSGLNL